jgi:hypothetical protein
MTPRAQTRLADQLMLLLEPKVRQAFLDDVLELKEGITLRDVQRMLERGDLAGAVAAVGLTRSAFRQVERQILSAFEDAGRAFTRLLPNDVKDPRGLSVTFRFDMRHRAAEAWLQRLSGTMITRLTAGQRETVLNHLQSALVRGANPRMAALELVGRIDKATGRRVGGVIGLTRPQTQYLRSMQDYLWASDGRYFDLKLRDKRFDNVIRRAINEGKPVPADTVARAARSYTNNMLRHRAEGIAQTETLNAIRGAKHIAFTQGAERAGLNADAVVREWSDTGDGRTRQDHADADGQRVQGDQPFTVGGQLLMYPGDSSLGASTEQTVRCRCVEIHRIDWIGELADA